MRRTHFICLVALLLLVASCVVAVRSVLNKRPSWQLSVHNLGRNIVVEVYLTNIDLPIYTTVLTEKNVTSEFHRLSREELSSDDGTTVFYDDTLVTYRHRIQ